ncbi:unnamed protein product [Brassicogethes aeneus]|uniref:Major facilitator superfamily (MFS) profile domain-containing protein n=1 Tax=Brassicogethes aeneus TaxID=1431903 RepID=A0A9P0AZD5_BRAAE|nr:unnamed protein product [Brassicogethes aeneus]
MDKCKNNTGQKQRSYHFYHQLIAALVASLGTLCTGTTLAWPSQIDQKLTNGEMGFSINTNEIGWISSVTSLGAATFSLFIGKICNRFGRKITLITCGVIMLAGWIIIIFAKAVWMLLIGRFISGMACGGLCVIVPLYINEIVEQKIRGSLGGLTQLSISVGILYSNICGYYFSLQVFAITCGFLSIIFVLSTLAMPETPIYFVESKNILGAKTVLFRLRQRELVDEELKELERIVNLDHHLNFVETLKICTSEKALIKAAIIGVALTLFKIFSGIDPLTVYLSVTFSNTKTVLGPNICSIIFATFQVLAGFSQTFVVDKWGRKKLLILSEFVISIALILSGIFLMFKSSTFKDKLPDLFDYVFLAVLCCFNIAFSLGIGPIQWVICSEIFPNEVKTFIFVIKVVPETKDKNYEDIRNELEK